MTLRLQALRLPEPERSRDQQFQRFSHVSSLRCQHKSTFVYGQIVGSGLMFSDRPWGITRPSLTTLCASIIRHSETEIYIVSVLHLAVTSPQRVLSMSRKET